MKQCLDRPSVTYDSLLGVLFVSGFDSEDVPVDSVAPLGFVSLPLPFDPFPEDASVDDFLA